MIKLFVIMALLMPGVWLLISHAGVVGTELSQYPELVGLNLRAKQSGGFKQKVEELRWGGRALHRESWIWKGIYNPGLRVLNEGFDLVAFASPRYFFVTGDGTNLSPATGGVIPVILFPVWVGGIVALVKKRSWKWFGVLIGLTLVAFLAGRRNMTLLWPVMLWYVAVIVVGLRSLNKVGQIGVVGLTMIYGLLIWQFGI